MKAKDIKDYIHLYIGCEVAVMLYDEYTYPGEIKGITESETEPGKTIAIVGKPFLEFYVEEVKPILRPLISMTEEEAVEFIHRKHISILTNIDRTEITKVSFGETNNIINFSYFRRRGAGAEAGSSTYYVNQSDSEQFIYLLSKGFDLFGLIESNLAVVSNK